MAEPKHNARPHWLNATTLGVGLTSLLSDWSHEMATAILPAFLVFLGAGPGWLGLIEGVADGLSSITKLVSGHLTDRMHRRKPLVVSAYAVTAAATGSIGLAANAIHVLLARSTAWLARGVRSPARKTILAAAVPAEAYGRAFGFERMMDTAGAIVAPLTALWLLQVTSHNYRHVFFWTLVPGLAAAASFGLLVRERHGEARERRSFLAGLRDLPDNFRPFLAAVGVFGLGDFSQTMLILYATQKLTPQMGATGAASMAVGLYLVRNVFYAGSAYIGGWLGDRAPQRKLILAGGYAVALAMAVLLAIGTPHIFVLGCVFALGGIFTGVEEALEDSITAEIVPAAQRGMAYGSLAAVNAIGDFASSLLVGFLWTAVAPAVAFATAGGLFAAGAILVYRLQAR